MITHEYCNIVTTNKTFGTNSTWRTMELAAAITIQQFTLTRPELGKGTSFDAGQRQFRIREVRRFRIENGLIAKVINRA